MSWHSVREVETREKEKGKKNKTETWKRRVGAKAEQRKAALV